MPAHSAAFVAIRDGLLRLDEHDRRRVADLLGAMHEPKPAISGDLAMLLGLIARLDPLDRRRLANWCARYLSRWGQVPVASSRGVKPGATPARAADAAARGPGT